MSQKHDVPEDWQEKKTSRFLKRIKTPVEIDPAARYQEIGIRSHGKGLFYKPLSTGKAIGNKSVFWVQPNCLILNIVFAWEQAVAKTTEAEDGMIASHRFPMFKPDENQVDLDYLLYFFKTKKGKHLLELASPGGAGRNKTLGQKEFSTISVPLPHIVEQKKIAKALKIWDQAIELTEKLLAKKQERRKGLMQGLLSGKRRLPGFAGKWKTVRMRDVFKRIKRTIPKGYSPEVLSITAKVGFVSQKEKFNKVIAGKNLSKYVLIKKGDFSYNKGNSKTYPQGCVFRLKEFEEGAVPNVFYSFHSSSQEVCSEFYSHYFAAGGLNHQLFRVINTGVRNDGLLNLHATDFFSLEILLPPFEEQQQIAKALDIYDQEIDLLKEKLTALCEQKKGLMQQLLTGKIRVKT